MMEDVKIILSYDGKQRYISYNSVVMGSNMLGPMTPGDAEYLVACIDACRWRPIETAPKDGSHVLLFRPEIVFCGYWSKKGWTISAPGLPLMLPSATHWRPIGPLPE